jgi:hypothetical protein
MKKIIKSNISLDETPEKCRLKKIIYEKEKRLNKLVEELEQLKIDLTVVKQEYEIKIGRLYLRLDEIDLEILKFKKIEDLISKGFSFEEARQVVEEALKKRREQIEEEYKKLNDKEKQNKNRKYISKEKREELKTLWQKLAHRYHPDKAGGNEELMKKINKAYAEGDLETLRAIDLSGNGDDIEKLTIEQLKKKLKWIEKSIQKISRELNRLKNSEWFILKENIEKAKKQNRDLLSELAEKLLTDIAKKGIQLDRIREKLQNKEKYG